MSAKRRKRQNSAELENTETIHNNDVISSKQIFLKQEYLQLTEELSRLMKNIKIGDLSPDEQKLIIDYINLYGRLDEKEEVRNEKMNKELNELLVQTLLHQKSDYHLFTERLLERLTRLESIKLEVKDLSSAIIENAVQLNEAKVLIVGQGEVGKTSLINRLLDNTFDPLESKTEGINIRKWSLPIKKKDVRLNIWDFGGQEIMHATHQFFLTKRSLYILVIAARKDEYQNNLEYWLKLIQSFGGESPIIVVINKSEGGSLDLARRSLQTKYPNIKAFVETSCKNGDGLQELKDSIIKELSDLKMVHDFVDARWLRIKAQLEGMKQDYIEFKQYQRICVKAGIQSIVEQRNLVRFLHDLGTLLNFGFSETTQRLDVRLENTNVINPEWVTKGVYAILNSSILNQGNGIIILEQLDRILDSNKYPKDKQVYIIEMMKKFELCFELAEERDKFLVVAGNLAKDEPDIRAWTEKNPLRFEFHYNFLPSSVISRFIVRMYQARIKNLYWRTGIAIKFQENEALVKADLAENKIYIYVNGNSRTRREFLAIIRSELVRINNTIAQLEAKEKVPYEGLLLDYDELVGYEEMGETSIVLPKLRKRVKVQEILATVELKDQRRLRDEKMKNNNPWMSGSFYLVAFVVIVVSLALLARYTSGIVVPVVLIAALLAISIIGALQLRNDDELKDESFLRLVIEFYKRLPLLRNGK